MTCDIDTDICVIGAGSGGLSVAAGAAQMGARVVLVEKDRMGGDCLNTGCIPSKALLAAAKAAHHAAHDGEKFGIGAGPVSIDFARVHRHVHDVIDGIAPHDSVERFESLGVTVIKGAARLAGKREVTVGETRIRAKRIVIATGSRAAVPPIKGIATTPFLTNETIFELQTLPDHLLIIGAGPIGLEMAQAFRRLGARVTVLERLTALPKDDPEMAGIVTTALRSEGVEILEGVEVIEAGGSAGAVHLIIGDKGETRRIEGSHLLIAAGRTPNVDDLGLEQAGIAYDKAGIKTDARLRTSNKRVFAIGDVRGGLQFTHVAGYDAGIVIRNILFRLPARADYSAVPWVTFTDPELAQVGLTESAARDRHGDRLKVLRFAYKDNDRARAERITEGEIKLMAYKGRPVGVTIVGAQAGELINFWSFALSAKTKLSAIAGYVSPYPTLAEINKRVATANFTDTLFSDRTKKIIRILLKLG